MPLNIANITIVRDKIASLLPEKFDMKEWANGSSRVGDIRHDCDSAACIGGWTDALFWPDEDGDVYRITPNFAYEQLGLTKQQGDDLFYPEEVPLSSITQQDAVTCLTRLIETGEVRWL